MNTTFDISRFGKLIVNELRLNYKKVMLTWLSTLGGLSLLTFGICALKRCSIDFGIILFASFTTSLIVQGFILSIFFDDFNSKTKSQATLLLPASQTEQFTAKWIMSILVFSILTALFIYLIIQLTFAYNQWAHEALNTNLEIPPKDWFYNYFIKSKMLLIFILPIWFIFSAIFLWGTLTFKKFAIVKTVVCWILIIVAAFLIGAFFYTLVSGQRPKVVIPFLVTFDKEQNAFTCIEYYEYFLHLVGLFTAIGLIIISWAKFKEKTV